MAGGAMMTSGDGIEDYPGKMTPFVFMACIVASSGGLIFGYDIGISGGVTSMSSFLMEFFPMVYEKEEKATGINQYCKLESVPLTLFTSSLYLAAFFSSLFASSITRTSGRKWTIFYGGITFLAGSAVNGAAMNVLMLILGRILLGIGIGFVNQSVPLYLSEMAPAKLRGTLNGCFQLMITIGILAANLVSYGTSKMEGGRGWRISLALAGVPALIVTFGSLALPETPNSLVERGYSEEAKEMLCKMRGTGDVLAEYEDLTAASHECSSKGAWANIIQKRYKPQLTMAVLIPLFQQLTGINVIMFYAPVIFKIIGFENEASLMSAVITGLVNVLATFVSIATVDRVGRMLLFLQGGLQMLISHVVVGTMMAVKFGTSGQSSSELSKAYAGVMVLFICVFVSAFAWSWGPLGWLVPSEIFPLEVRSAGQSVAASVDMLFTFLIAQVFLCSLCYLKFGLFYFFAGWMLVMTGFVLLFLPETKNVPVEKMILVWKEHWFWAKYVTVDAGDDDKILVGHDKI